MPDDPTDQPVVDPDPTPAPDPEPAWGGVSQEQWTQAQQFMQQVGQAIPAMYEMLQTRGGEADPQPPASAAPDYDPFDQNSVDAYIAHQIGSRLDAAFQEHLGPFEGLLGSLANERGEAMARQELESLRGSIGDFNDDLAYVIASGIIDRGGDPQSALPQAAQFAYDYEARIRSDEREKYKAELQGLSSAPGEAVGGAATTEIDKVPTGPDRYRLAVERALARGRPVIPTG